ncbi:MAG: hypothetical protein IH891_07480 [Planctomycetes bacterium]|nr:hypothetical protein [Planctomycetota bacterium]
MSEAGPEKEQLRLDAQKAAAYERYLDDMRSVKSQTPFETWNDPELIYAAGQI